MRRFLEVSLLFLVILAPLATTMFLIPYITADQGNVPFGFHVGVAFGGNTTAEAKLLIDRVKTYTNLFVVQSGPVSGNEKSLNEIVDYAVSSGLDVIVFFGFFGSEYPWRIPWLDYAKEQWGSRFLGVYLNDEPGGVVIDYNWTGVYRQIRLRNTVDYYLHLPEIDLALNGTLAIENDQAAKHFIRDYKEHLGLEQLKNRSLASFTADYALYWLDYLVGYDTILAEFGSNQSINQPIAMTRGAARMQNKNWGVIITWTYEQPPYLVNGTEMYDQMVCAYTSGAEYVVIFNYPQIPGNPYGVMTDEHFAALEGFWSNISGLKKSSQAQAVLVLPRNYGWGMRHENDLIWGIWKPDDVSAQIWNVSRTLLDSYDLSLDIVYDDPNFPVQGRYEQIYYWNQTVLR